MTVVEYQVTGPVLKWRLVLLTERVSVASDEPIRFTVFADSNGLPVDPRSSTVQMAFLSSTAAPGVSDWHNGSWDVTVIGSYVAQINSGATGANLTAGEYYAWIKIAGTGETPVRQVGTVYVQ